MTDNPSGSTGQNVTAPANAPAGDSDSSDREWLSNLIHDDQREQCDLDPEGFYDCEQLADRILAAGFTRAQHDGERVAALERERDAAINNHACLKEVWDAQCAHVFEACKMLGVDTDAQPGDSWTLREWCVRVKAERDAAMSLAEGAHAQVASCCAIAFEVDTMAVDDERMLTLEDRIADTIEARDAAAHDRDAAIARAEAAEAKLAQMKLYADAADRAFQGRDAILPGFVRLGHCKAEGIVRLAEAHRAGIAERAALAEIVRKNAESAVHYARMRSAMECIANSVSVKHRDAQKIARAALAGNGTGA